ncbi:MAG: hypothetical protein Q9181_006006 [Wetmoreana brouardii]
MQIHRRGRETVGREVREFEYERREQGHILAAEIERTRQQERLPRDREHTLAKESERRRIELNRLREEEPVLAERRERRRTEQDRLARDSAEQSECRGREEDRFGRDRELTRRESDFLGELSTRDRERMERDLERVKISRKDRRTNSGRTITEPRQSRVERTLSSGLSTPIPEAPKSFFSRWSSFFPSDAVPKIETSSKVAKSEPQPKSTQSTSIDLEGYFLQPAEDSYLQRSVTALSDSIDQHVYNHYGDRTIGPSYDVFLRTVQIDNEDLLFPKTLFSQESVRLAAIRRSIASAIIKDISVEGRPSTTLLPREIVSLLSMVPAHSSEKFVFAASSAFRRTAANLLRLSQSGESPEYTEFRRMQVKNASDRLHKQLSALASPDSSEDARRDQLEAIMAEAAQIGVLLLLQPATHRFEWHAQFSAGSSFDDQGKAKLRPGPFVVFPALIRTGDSMGRELRRPQLVCQPEYLDEDDLAENGKI